MADKKQSAKARAASLKNLKKARAALNGGNPNNKPAKRRKAGNPSNPRRRTLRKTFKDFSQTAGDAGVFVAATNAPAVILTGRSWEHPGGGLDKGSSFSDGSLSLAAPAPGGPFKGTDRIMIDVGGLLFDPVNRANLRQSAITRGLRQQNPYLNGIAQNFSNAFRTPQGRAAVARPIVAGLAVKAFDVFVTPLLLGAADAFTRTTRGLLPRGRARRT